MAALLVSLAVMSVLMSAVLPVWRFQARREKEAELVFRGEQYARAVGLFARKNGGAFPPNLDVLVQGRYIRKKYKDPMTKDGEFQPLFAGSNLPGQPQQPGVPSGRGAAPGMGGGRVGGGRVGGGSQGAGRIGPPIQTGGIGGGGLSGGAGGGVAGGGFQSNPGQATGPGGLIGVVSKSKESSIMIYRGGSRYNEWVFRYAGLQNQPGAVPGQGMPGMPQMGPGGQPMPGGRGGRGGRGRGPGPGPGGFDPRGIGRSVRPPG